MAASRTAALFYLCYAGRYTDYNARLGPKERAYIRLIDEIAQHSLCYIEVCDNAVLHGADGNDIAGGTPDSYPSLRCRQPEPLWCLC